jgi:hypothetical protein
MVFSWKMTTEEFVSRLDRVRRLTAKVQQLRSQMKAIHGELDAVSALLSTEMEILRSESHRLIEEVTEDVRMSNLERHLGTSAGDMRSKATVVLTMIEQGAFDYGKAAKELYGVVNGQTRHRLYAVLSYLKQRKLIEPDADVRGSFRIVKNLPAALASTETEELEVEGGGPARAGNAHAAAE